MVIFDRYSKKVPAKLAAFLSSNKITTLLNNLARSLSFYWRPLLKADS